jgi:hypothetical protein
MTRKKCIILLPTAYNDGSPIPSDVLRDIYKDIDREFDGHSIVGHVDGTYKMDDGSMVSDKSIMVLVVVKPDRVDDLKVLAARTARVLKQESIYFEVTQAEVEFVRPLPETGERS